MITASIDKEVIENFLKTIRQVVKEEITEAKQVELQEKLYSPAEACKIFNPKISIVTLAAWTKAGHLKRYDLGGRVWYKYSEITEAAKNIKRYQR